MKQCICFFVHQRVLDGRPKTLLVRLGDYLILPRHEQKDDQPLKDVIDAAFKTIAMVVHCGTPELFATEDRFELDGRAIRSKFYWLPDIKMTPPRSGRASYSFDKSLFQPDLFVDFADRYELFQPAPKKIIA